jgi:hypothetical protein
MVFAGCFIALFFIGLGNSVILLKPVERRLYNLLSNFFFYYLTNRNHFIKLIFVVLYLEN